MHALTLFSAHLGNFCMSEASSQLHDEFSPDPDFHCTHSMRYWKMKKVTGTFLESYVLGWPKLVGLTFVSTACAFTLQL